MFLRPVFTLDQYIAIMFAQAQRLHHFIVELEFNRIVTSVKHRSLLNVNITFIIKSSRLHDNNENKITKLIRFNYHLLGLYKCRLCSCCVFVKFVLKMNCLCYELGSKSTGFKLILILYFKYFVVILWMFPRDLMLGAECGAGDKINLHQIDWEIWGICWVMV